MILKRHQKDVALEVRGLGGEVLDDPVNLAFGSISIINDPGISVKGDAWCRPLKKY